MHVNGRTRYTHAQFQNAVSYSRGIAQCTSFDLKGVRRMTGDNNVRILAQHLRGEKINKYARLVCESVSVHRAKCVWRRLRCSRFAESCPSYSLFSYVKHIMHLKLLSSLRSVYGAFLWVGRNSARLNMRWIAFTKAEADCIMRPPS